jgi:hypothetical protein
MLSLRQGGVQAGKVTENQFVFHDKRLAVAARLRIWQEPPLLVAAGFGAVAVNAVAGESPESVIKELLLPDPILHRDVKNVVVHTAQV